MKTTYEKFLAFDIETDALENYSKIHCIVTVDQDGILTEYLHPTEDENARKSFIEAIQKAEQTNALLAGHHILSYDLRVLAHFFPEFSYPKHLILDTLVMSRLLNFGMPGGHSIEAWGERVGVRKQGTDITDWSQLTPLMLDRCKSDTKVVAKMLEIRFLKFINDPSWQEAIASEHEVARICLTMTENGLGFDLAKAKTMKARLQPMLDVLDEELKTAFPPEPVFVRTVEPRKTKSGALSLQDFRWAQNWEFSYDPYLHRVIWKSRRTEPTSIVDLSDFYGSPFDIYEMVPFNPGSPKQMVARLNEAGWKPTEKTKGHIEAQKDRKTWAEKSEYFQEFGWKVNEENLKTLPDTAPEPAKKLAQRLILASRLSDLDEWITLAVEEADGARIHGSFMPIGAWTQRLSHMKPNTANIPVAKRSLKDTEFQKFINDINDEMRSLFIAGTRQGQKMRMVGTDADGIQMRIFAHLVGDQRLIDSLVKGSKENGTDIHTLHKGFLGDKCKSRDAAKTFIYAFLLGAGIAKVSEILECSFTDAKTSVANFLEAYPGLKTLKKTQIPSDAERGFFIGLDGRKVVCNSEHLMLAGYLQNGEKIIMARWIEEYTKKANEAGLEHYLLNWVHDETMEILPDNDDTCEQFQQIQLDAMIKVGENLGLVCPLKATTAKGYDWHDVH